MWVRDIYKQRSKSGTDHILDLQMALGDRKLYFK